MLLASQEGHQQPGCPLTVQAGEAQAAHCSVVRCTKVEGGGGRWGMKVGEEADGQESGWEGEGQRQGNGALKAWVGSCAEEYTGGFE